jgi:biotin carboxylase
MKKLLVLAAGILQVPVIKRAREMGYYVIAADNNPNAVGLQYADKQVCADITNEETMLEIARQEKIDGVIHPCSEVSMNVMGRINDELSLSGISRNQAIIATNKHLMRAAFENGSAPSPISLLTKSADDAWEHFRNDIDGDAILKPSRNSGSRGIAKVSKSNSNPLLSKEEFTHLYNVALTESRDNSVLIEQFIDGPEFSVEIIVWGKNVNVLAVTDKKTTGAPHFVELGHNQPSCFSEETVELVKAAAIKGVKALGVDKCACHAEVKVMGDKAYLMEIGARMGGDFISTILTKLSTGIDMVAAAINCALNIAPDLSPKSAPQAVCIRYICPNPGVLKCIKNVDILENERVFEYEIYPKIGDTIHEVTSSLCRSGHVIVTEKTPKLAIDLAERLINNIKLETV